MALSQVYLAPTVFLAQPQHQDCNINKTHPCPLVALSQVEETSTEAHGGLRPHWRHVQGGAKESSIDPGGAEDGFGEGRLPEGKAFELGHEEQIGLL